MTPQPPLILLARGEIFVDVSRRRDQPYFVVDAERDTGLREIMS
jgi:ferric-dicitrate binding protein FerR (iron transport regulator)